MSGWNDWLIYAQTNANNVFFTQSSWILNPFSGFLILKFHCFWDWWIIWHLKLPLYLPGSLPALCLDQQCTTTNLLNQLILQIWKRRNTKNIEQSNKRISREVFTWWIPNVFCHKCEVVWAVLWGRCHKGKF